MLKILGAVLIIGAVLLATFANEEVQNIVEWKLADNSQRLGLIIERDFKALQSSNQLPKEWASIGTVTYSINSETAKKLLEKHKPNLTSKPGSEISLELEIFDIPDDKKPGLVIQASLMNKKNKIFEIGRNIYLEEINKE